MKSPRSAGALAVLAWFAAQTMVPLAASNLAIDPAKSHVLIDVGKAGVFGFAGHLHEVAAPSVHGTVTFDPADWQKSAVAVTFDAAALRVTGKGDPPADIPKVQEVMQSDRVLDVAKFPTVTFKSRKIAVLGQSAQGANVQIDGDITLHGVTRPVSVRARASLAGGDTLTTQGTFTLKQSDFGIEPVTAAGGTVRVRDSVDVQFTLVAHR